MHGAGLLIEVCGCEAVHRDHWVRLGALQNLEEKQDRHVKKYNYDGLHKVSIDVVR